MIFEIANGAGTSSPIFNLDPHYGFSSTILVSSDGFGSLEL